MDKKAKDILFKTYWSAQGWRSQPITSPEDFYYAKSKGLMFDPLSITEAELLSQLDKTVRTFSLKRVTDAFLSSLTNKRLDWRSALASYANARRTLAQNLSPTPGLSWGKNLDLNILNFERIKWGGVRHTSPLYNLFDLELLDKDDVTLPTSEDILCFKNILNTIYNSKPNDTPGKLRDNLKGLLKTSKYETHTLMEILGAAGIINPSKYDRKEPGKHDWVFITFWRGEDGYDKEKVKFYFGDYGII